MNLDSVILLATRLHFGQTDKAGRPYISHPERVAAMVRASGGTWVQEQAAWLHDVIEDAGVTGDALISLGVPAMVVAIVEYLTHPKGESNADYWARIKTSPTALLVKICDVHDNLDPSRLCYLDQPTQDRLRRKYATALLALVDE